MVTETKLALGSVQWGLAYGIANARGQSSEREVQEMLAIARASGIDTLDTARAYGEAEAVIGRALGASGDAMRVITKLSPSICEASNESEEIARALRRSLTLSRQALNTERLDVVLLHRPEHRTISGGLVWRLLLEERDAGRIGQLGVSATSPESAMQALEDPAVQVMQVASSLLDRRLEDRGFFARARQRGVEVHVRSTFLQGLAFLPLSALPGYLSEVGSSLEAIDQWAEARGVARSTLFLAYALNLGASYLVLGCERPTQLQENLESLKSARGEHLAVATLAARLPRLGEDVLDPSKWPSAG